jgi:DNA-binding transcriptional LysR family regulator
MSGSEQGAPRRTLTVGFVAGVAPDKWARVWAERMPDVALRLRALEADAIVDAFDGHGDEGVEMAFARLPLRDGQRQLNSISLWDETPIVVVPKDHPIKLFDAVTLADLADENVLDGQDDATLDLVAAGVGVARMPQAVLRANGRRDVIGRPVSDAEPSRIALVWPSDIADEAIDEFIGVVRGRTVQSSRGAAEAPLQPVKKAKLKAAAQKAAAEKAAAKKAGGQKAGGKTAKSAKARPQIRRGAPRKGR